MWLNMLFLSVWDHVLNQRRWTFSVCQEEILKYNVWDKCTHNIPTEYYNMPYIHAYKSECSVGAGWFAGAPHLVGWTVWRVHNDEQRLSSERVEVPWMETKKQGQTSQKFACFTFVWMNHTHDRHAFCPPGPLPVHLFLSLTSLLHRLSIDHIPVGVGKNPSKVIGTWRNTHRSSHTHTHTHTHTHSTHLCAIPRATTPTQQHQCLRTNARQYTTQTRSHTYKHTNHTTASVFLWMRPMPSNTNRIYFLNYSWCLELQG